MAGWWNGSERGGGINRNQVADWIGICRYTKNEFIQRKIWEIGPFKDILASKISFKKLQEKKYIRYDNLPLETKNGKRKEYEFVSNIYTEGNKKVIQCNIRDNSDRKLAEELSLKLQQQQQKEQKEQQLQIFNKQLDNIMNAIRNPIFIKDEYSVFLFANDSLCVMLGLDKDKIIGKTLADSLPAGEIEHFIEIDKMVIESGQENICEETVTGKDGKILDVVTRKTRYINEKGNRYLVGVVHDLTEYKNLEKQLLQSQKMESIGTLAGGVAHDFNNLLTVIKGNVYLAQKKIGKENPVAAEHNEIENAANRAAELTKQMLLFSRQQHMIAVNLNLNDIVEDTFKMVSRLIGEDIKVKKKLQTGLWNIHADKTKIEQILLNLTVNARDAMPNGGGLKVETENVVLKETFLPNVPEAYPGKFVKLSVQDEGIGMSKDIIQHIFEPYFTTKGVGKGTGLGLSVVYGIVKQHKGWISIYSKLGKGSIFSVNH